MMGANAAFGSSVVSSRQKYSYWTLYLPVRRYQSLDANDHPTGFRSILKQNMVENFYKNYLYFAENGLTLHSEYIG